MERATAKATRAGVMLMVGIVAVAVLGVASPAQAAHTVCDNEGVPGDVWANVSNVAFVGVDTGTSGAVGVVVVCASALGGSPVGVGGGARVNDPNPAAVGNTVTPTICSATSCTALTGQTGAEFTPGVARTEGTPLVCVGTVCVRGQKVTAGTLVLYVLGGTTTVPVCVSAGPGVSCP